MKEIIYKIKELEKLGFYKLADKLDSELIKIAQMPPNLLPPNLLLPNLLPPVNSAPLNTFEISQIRNMLKQKKSDSANDTNVLSPGLQNNQNQSTIEKRLNDLLGKYVALEKRSKNTMDKFPPIISTNEDQNSDIDTNTQDIMNLKTQLGNTQTEEPEEPTV
jgi:hypothetical protein